MGWSTSSTLEMQRPRRCATTPGHGQHRTGGANMGNRTCSVNGCEREHYARGMCNPHYQRVRTSGTLDGDALPPLSAGERRTCSVLDCNLPHWAKGMCRRHYYRKPLQEPRIKRAPLVCAIDGCARLVDRSGFCAIHHYRWKRYGDPLKRTRLQGDLEGRFWQKVNQSGPTLKAGLGPCWIWESRVGSGPYGKFLVGRKLVSAYRFSYELLVGQIPTGLVLDHLCSNPPCVNPQHLEPVTQRENNRRGEGWGGRNARKQCCPRGHPYDETNTYLRPDGKGRDCLTCRRARSADRRRITMAESSLHSDGREGDPQFEMRFS